MQVLVIIAFVLFLIGESLTSWLFIRGSRKKHPGLWEHARRPTLMGNGNLLNAWPLVRYVTRRDYAAVPEPHSVTFAEALRLPLIVTYWGAVASAILLVGTLLLDL
jgi:hypothetical protein